MKYVVQLISENTGEAQVLEVEASSAEEAIGMFDASKFAVSIVPPETLDQAAEERAKQLVASIAHWDSHAIALQLTILAFVAALFVGCVVSTALRSQVDRGSGDSKRSKQSDAEKALWIHTLQDR
ncbi:hypothetical protein [Bremerella alba]|uniref:Uncharacterized protein n=1 Tax=Bremerella alba TaxID=980252 RepID=A0A7V8V8V4_9BACT|nr:hypothetical protein [Bremerella alba]MBA2116786.1 hypothetical protein [Bremerella alba]